MTDDIDNDATTLHESGGVVQPTDAQLAIAAYTGYDDYWEENSLGDETEAWLSSAKAVLALALTQAPLQAEPAPVVASEPGVLLRQALIALESCGAGAVEDGGNQWFDEKLVDAAHYAIEEYLTTLGEP